MDKTLSDPSEVPAFDDDGVEDLAVAVVKTAAIDMRALLRAGNYNSAVRIARLLSGSIWLRIISPNAEAELLQKIWSGICEKTGAAPTKITDQLDELENRIEESGKFWESEAVHLARQTVLVRSARGVCEADGTATDKIWLFRVENVGPLTLRDLLFLCPACAVKFRKIPLSRKKMVEMAEQACRDVQEALLAIPLFEGEFDSFRVWYHRHRREKDA